MENITDVRGTAFVRRSTPRGWFEIDSISVDTPGRVEDHVNPYLTIADQAKAQGETCKKEDSSSSPPGRARVGGGGKQPLRFMPNPALQARPQPSPQRAQEGARRRANAQ